MLSPTSARCPVSAVQPSVQAPPHRRRPRRVSLVPSLRCNLQFRPPAFDPAETRQKRRDYPRQFGKKMGGQKIPVRGCRIFLTPSFCQKEWRFKPKPQLGRRMGALFLCPHSSVIPRAPPIYHESIFREYRDALHPSAQGTVRTTFADIPGVLARGEDSGPHSPLCGSEPGDIPSAQGTARTTYADISGVLCARWSYRGGWAEHLGPSSLRNGCISESSTKACFCSDSAHSPSAFSYLSSYKRGRVPKNPAPCESCSKLCQVV